MAFFASASDISENGAVGVVRAKSGDFNLAWWALTQATSRFPRLRFPLAKPMCSKEQFSHVCP